MIEKSQDSFFGKMLSKLQSKTIPYESLEDGTYQIEVLSARNVKRSKSAMDYAFAFISPEIDPEGEKFYSTSAHHSTSLTDPKTACAAPFKPINTVGHETSQHFSTSLTRFGPEKNKFFNSDTHKSDLPCAEVLQKIKWWSGQHLGPLFAFDIPPQKFSTWSSIANLVH